MLAESCQRSESEGRAQLACCRELKTQSPTAPPESQKHGALCVFYVCGLHIKLLTIAK